MLSHFFYTTAAASVIGYVCQTRFECSSARSNVSRGIRHVSENSELFKKSEPGAQVLLERISSCDLPSCSLDRSETVPTINSRYSSFLDHERSLDPERLRRALWRSAKNGTSPLGLWLLSALWLDFRRGKAFFTFCPHTVSLVKDRPRKLNLSASQWLSRTGIPKPPLQRRSWQTYGPLGFELPKAI